jgi:hypothetical protein
LIELKAVIYNRFEKFYVRTGFTVTYIFVCVIQLFRELCEIYQFICVIFLYVFIYIYGWYVDWSPKTKNLFKIYIYI